MYLILFNIFTLILMANYREGNIFSNKYNTIQYNFSLLIVHLSLTKGYV